MQKWKTFSFFFKDENQNEIKFYKVHVNIGIFLNSFTSVT